MKPDQPHFTIIKVAVIEVAVDWQESMVLQC